MFKASSTIASFEYLIQLVWLILHLFCTCSFKDLQSNEMSSGLGV